MGNLIDSMTRSEREQARQEKSVYALNNTIYYSGDSYVMLTNGRLHDVSKLQTPVIFSQLETPNNRLINQFKTLLSEMAVNHNFQHFGGKASRKLVISWHLDYGNKFSGWKVLLWSSPVNGKSYVKAQVISTASDTHLDFCFIAQSPIQILSKLREFDLIPSKKNHTPKDGTQQTETEKGGNNEC